MSKKIQLIADNFIGYSADGKTTGLFGGQELLLAETVRLLKSDGWDISILQTGKISRELEFEGVPIKQIKAPDLKLIQKFGFIKRWTWLSWFFLNHIDRTADVVHFHNHHFSFPAVFKRKPNQVFTGMNHGVEWDVPWVFSGFSLRNCRDRFAFFLLRKISSFSISKLDRMITNDRFFVHFGTLKNPNLISKFFYIPNYFDERVFNTENSYKSSEVVERVKEFVGDDRMILLPKMSMRERGTDLMLDVIKEIEGAKLVITGVSHQQSAYLNKVLLDVDLAKRVHFTGHVDYHNDLPALFKLTDIVVIPSPCREATAIALLEAMAMKKPVIVAEIGGLVEVVHDRVNGLVRKPSVSQFIDAIDLLLSDEKLSRRLAANGQKTVIKFFNRKVWSKRMLEFFNV